MNRLAELSPEIRQYLIVTGNYWSFTLTDGALRMLIVLYFHALGYSPLEVAMLFLFYEFFGVVTNLFGGWLGAHLGLNKTMNVGLFLQILALAMLLVPNDYLSVVWVMAAQALSGIAKDLNKMSAKSAIKMLVPNEAQGQLYKWVAILTGSKNTLKGIGFFLGGALLTLVGFQCAILLMAVCLLFVWLFSVFSLKKDLGKARNKPKFSEIFSKSRSVNILSAARMFLFASRDVWFVVALPVYLSTQLQWNYWQVGMLLALWVIFYGFIQTLAPKMTGINRGKVPDGNTALLWSLPLILSPMILALSLALGFDSNLTLTIVLVIGLFLFGGLFAINSSIHSYLIVSYAREDGASLDIGFYYMANALGRLIGTVLSGWLFQVYGLVTCLIVSAGMITVCIFISISLPKHNNESIVS
ncbi:MAG: MFS family permease [Oleiphilaceae bacterium]|jgi:MFS family permease